MKNAIAFMIIAIMFAACVENGKAGLMALTSFTEEEAGENCANGGMKVETGIDESGDGVLDEDEVQDTKYICNGESGTDGSDGADGLDGTEGDKGDPGEDGLDGTDGINGEKGDPGDDGLDGTDGEKGDPGEDGTDGADGEKGDPGEDGSDGVCAGNHFPVIDSVTINNGKPVPVYGAVPLIITAHDDDTEDTLSYILSGSGALITDNGNGSFEITIEQEGNYNLAVIVSDGCQLNTAQFAVEVRSMVTIPGNSFWQGCRTNVNGSTADLNCYGDESPYHQVTVPSFQMDVYEVTNAQYIQFLNANGNICFEDKCVESSSYFRLSESAGLWSVDSGFEKYPVNEVTWYGAKAYCEWAGKRLPSESEWEFAARGTDERLYPWGDETVTCDYAVMSEGGYGCGTSSPYSWAVGSKPNGISPYGIYDMAGNVWEWVEDDAHGNYSEVGRPDDGSAWIDDPRGSHRVLRGASWYYSNQNLLRASYREFFYPDQSFFSSGFRCASDL